MFRVMPWSSGGEVKSSEGTPQGGSLSLAFYYYMYYYLHVRVGVDHASMIHDFAYADHDKQNYDRGKKLS